MHSLLFVTTLAAVTKKTRLAQYLEKTGMTHEALADRLGISRPYVTMMAMGKRQPALRLALRIESVTGVPAAALLTAERVA